MHEDPFHPRHYRDVRRPPGEASTLPGWCYISETFLRREHERIFSRAWLFAGRLEEIPLGGARTVETARGKIILARSPALSAFTDAGRHHQIRVTVWAGFVFVCFSRRTAGLESWLGDMTQRLASHRLAEFRVTRRRHYTVRANWKLIAENAMEAYHTGTVHGDSLGAQASRDLVTRGH